MAEKFPNNSQNSANSKERGFASQLRLAKNPRERETKSGSSLTGRYTAKAAGAGLGAGIGAVGGTAIGAISGAGAGGVGALPGAIAGLRQGTRQGARIGSRVASEAYDAKRLSATKGQGIPLLGNRLNPLGNSTAGEGSQDDAVTALAKWGTKKVAKRILLSLLLSILSFTPMIFLVLLIVGATLLTVGTVLDIFS